MKMRTIREDAAPGLIGIFQFYLLTRLGIGVAQYAIDSIAGERLRLPAYGLAEAVGLLIYLRWTWLKRPLGRYYLPLALALAGLLPILTQSLRVFNRLRVGTNVDYAYFDIWQTVAFITVPVILTGWQYGFRGVMALVGISTVLDSMATVVIASVDQAQFVALSWYVGSRAVVFLQIGYIVSQMMDVQRRQRELLEKSNLKLARYAFTVEQLGVSRERVRMARELHDTLAHSLSALAVQLEAIDALWEQSPVQARQALATASDLAHSGLGETRRALQALRAKPLEELGLALALRQLAESAAARAGLRLEADIPALQGDFDPEVEQTAYRIAEEAISNTVRHASAHTLTVVLTAEGAGLRLRIADDGRGFDPGAAENGHYGLLGMRERAALCGGALDLQSKPGAGTNIVFAVDVKADGESGD